MDTGTSIRDMLAGLGNMDGAQLLSLVPFALLLITVGFFIRRIWQRVTNAIEDTIFSNWRLALLAATGLVLSLASGWTTWDGMRNFTNEPTLSLMITFGIQGVMLIVAWLIGESFATGMRVRAGGGTGGWDLVVAALFSILALVAITMWYGQSTASAGAAPANWFDSETARTIKNFSIFGAITALVLAFIIAATKSDVGANYVQSARLIFKNSMLWLMFLATMATSVFFSFDSLFTTIFPADERKRAAEIRATNEVARVVSDIGTLASKRRLEEARALFQAPAWSDYELELDKVERLAREAPDKIRAQISQELEAQKSRIAELEEKRATATGGQAGLQTRKNQLTEELSRLQGERPEAVASASAQKVVVSEIERRLDEQRTKVLAEEKGVEGSGKVGRGQFWRAAKADEEKVRAELQVAEERLRGPAERVTSIDKRVAQIKAELAQIDGDLAKLKGEADTAAQMISVAKEGTAADNSDRFDPAAGVASLARQRQAFRQKPDRPTLAAIQSQCAALVGAALKVDSLRDTAAGVDCNPKQAIEAAARVFALNAGLDAFSQNCAGGEHLPTNGSTDALLEFGRRCLQDSGLAGADTTALGATLSRIDLNRDDKAHRFVVTWNAFQDGNRLAYLALTIAIAIDSLVFMSGLFGANAVRSPLSDVPSLKARSAQQLEAIIENALLPDTFANADAVLSAMQPITPLEGYTQEVVVPPEETINRNRVLKVLNAAATIGAVYRDVNRPERYLVRPELFEFLSTVAKRSFESDKENVKLAELKQVVSVALQPDIGRNAEIVLNNMTPINEAHGFSSQIRLRNVAADELSVVRKVLNAGATLQYVQHHEPKRTDDHEQPEDLYFVHGQLYKTIALLSAAFPRPAAGPALAPMPAAPAIAGPSRDPIDGGTLGTGTTPPAGGELQSPRRIARPPESTRSPTRQLTQAPLSQQEREHFEALFEDELLGALGLNSRTVAARFAGEGVQEAALSVWRELQRHAAANHDLGQLLRQHQSDQEKLLDATYQSLKNGTHGDQRKGNLLDACDHHIREALPALMLFPETGLVRYLIEELELAAGPDDGQRPEEHTLLEQLRQVNDLMSHSDLADAGDWVRIRAALTERRVGGEFPRIVRLPPHPKNGSGTT
ncbi:MAG: hypothetical protein KDJ45_11730 [Hyphomicrobiaceae bacterium]|nr:hypothetical protein [Hyphomicrobiaceae bacterium]MCC0010679.1 hypothetical protein [Hyphomicrobiaceae bacterium]